MLPHQRADLGHHFLKSPIPVPYHLAIGYSRELRSADKPIANLLHGSAWCCPMRVNVLAVQVRNELQVPVWVTIQNQTILAAVNLAAKDRTAQKKAEFKRHVETRQPCLRVYPDVGKVANAQRAHTNERADLGKPRIGSVVALQRTAGDKTYVPDRENYGVEHLPVASIKRTVYEDTLGRVRTWHG
jgi:hypothetical protein